MNVHDVASPTDPHWVYRFFDSAGAALYVGCTSNMARRLGDHQRYREWYPDVARIEVTSHDGYADGMAAEASEIQRLNPTHNSVHTDHRTPSRPICARCRRSKHDFCLGVNTLGQDCPCSICEARRKRTAA